MTQKGRLLAAIVVLTVAVSGFAGPATTALAADVELRLWITGPSYKKFGKMAAKEFEKANPGIKVKVANLDWSAYAQKIVTAVSGGTPPDVFSFYSVNVAPWAAGGMLRPLDDVVDKGAFYPAAIANGIYDDKIYAVPIGMRMRAFFYRKDILSKAGYAAPPETWNELSDYAKKLVKYDSSGNLERTGFWVPTSHPYKTIQMWLAFLWSNGGEVFTPDGKQAAFNQAPGVEATQFLDDMLNKHKVDRPGSIKADNLAFVQGRVAMLLSNVVTRGLLKNAPDKKDTVGIALPPAAKNKVVEFSGEMMGVASNTKHPEEAVKLMKFVAMHKPIALQYYAADDGLPALKSVKAEELAERNPWIGEYLKLTEYGRPLPAHPNWFEISNIVTAALDEVYVNKRPAMEALDAAADKVNALLAK